MFTVKATPGNAKQKGSLDTITETFTLTDKIVTTLGPGRFLYATDDQAYAIADVARVLGQDDFEGVVNWYLVRNADTFVDATVLLAALRPATLAAHLKTRPVFSVTADEIGAKSRQTAEWRHC